MKSLAERYVMWYIRRTVGYRNGNGRRILAAVAAAWIEMYREDNLQTLIKFGEDEIAKSITDAYERSIK